MQPLIVHRLEIVCKSDDTPDPYGQAGFSVVIAYVFSADTVAFEEARVAASSGKLVAVRCGGLEVRGRVFEHNLAKTADRVAISVETVHPHNALAAGGAT